MIRSMTGFGSAARDDGGVRATASVRSVNHRFLEVHCPLPRRLFALEADVKELVQSRLARGRVDVTLTVPAAVAAGTSVAVNRPLIGALVEALRSVQADLDLGGEIRVGDVTRFPGALEVVETDAGPDQTLKAVLLGVVDAALQGVLVMRGEEGDRLGADLLSRIERVEKSTLAIEALSRETRAARVEALVSKTAELRASLGLDEARLYQEIVRAVERHDVTEETERLRSHVAMIRTLVAGPDGAVGKRLDFLAQELMREANTIGSKAADAGLVQAVVELKADVERFREQVQNAE